jgi:hypothetical protein
MRRGTAWGEDISKQAVYWRHALKDTKAGAVEAQMTFEDYARAVAKGDLNPELADRALEQANKALGDMGTPDGKLGLTASRLVLYHSWLGHVAKLMLWTMPMERPGAFLVMNSLARYGDQYRKEHGVWPRWMTDYARVADHMIGGHKFATVVGLGQLAPQNTAGQFLSTLTSDRPWAERIASLSNPLIGAGINTVAADYANRTSYYQPQSISRLLANQALYAIPGFAKFAPRAGQDPTSIPLISPRQIQYTTGQRGTAYHPNTVKWENRLGVRPMGSDAPLLSWENALGIGSRVLGAPLSYAPVEGSINDAIIKKAEGKGKSGGYGSYAKK